MHVTIQIKHFELYFPVVWLLCCTKWFLTFDSGDEILKNIVTIHMKFTGQYLTAVLFIMLYKVALTF